MIVEVAIFPKEYLVLPMNTESRIFCNVTDGLILRRWTITGFEKPFDKDVAGIVTDGIIITDFTRTASVLLLNTSEIAIDFITLECASINSSSLQEKSKFLNVTIYGKFLH